MSVTNLTSFPLYLKDKEKTITIESNNSIDGEITFNNESGIGYDTENNTKKFVFLNLDKGYDLKLKYISTMFVKNKDDEFYSRIDIIEQTESGELLSYLSAK